MLQTASALKRLLVVGVTGLVGSKVAELAPGFGFEPHGTYNARQGKFSKSYKLDVTDKNLTFDLVKKLRPDAIVDTAALHNVDYCESHREEATKVNVEGTENLVGAARETGSMLVYLSTDYVFDGKKGNYVESDPPNPLHYYARTKLEGEKIVANLPGSAIARPSVIYGWNSLERSDTPSSSGKTLNFAMYALDKLQKGERIKAVNDQFSSPTFADNLAEALLRIASRRVAGIFHTAGRSCLSRYEFAIHLAKVFGYPEAMIEPVSTSALKQMAERPRNSCLGVEHAEGVLRMRFLTAEEGLSRMKDQLPSISQRS